MGDRRRHRKGAADLIGAEEMASFAYCPEQWRLQYGLRLPSANRVAISARVPRAWHRIQLGVYFLLIEDQLGYEPPHGFVVLGDGTRHRIENTPELRSEVLELARRIRIAKASPREPIPVRPVPGQCRPCGIRDHCGQAQLRHIVLY